MKAHVVEDEELCFGTKVNRVGDARELEITLRATRHAARVQPVTFFGNRVNYVCDETQSLLAHQGIYPVTIGVRDEQHVRFVNRSLAAKTRAVEAETIIKSTFR